MMSPRHINSGGNQCSSRPRAVLFDLDGVLIDSMPQYYRAWVCAFAAFGVPDVDETEVYEREGEAYETTAAALYRLAKGCNPASDLVRDIVEAQQTQYCRTFTLRLFEGAAELVSLLYGQGVRLGLVTGSRVLPQPLQARTELMSCFSVVVTGDRRRRGKPAPDPYLLGLERLGMTDPASCVVVENAPLGIRAACAAQMPCIAVRNSTVLSRERLLESGARAVCERLSEVDAALTAGTVHP